MAAGIQMTAAEAGIVSGGRDAPAPEQDSVLTVRSLTTEFRLAGKTIRANADLSLSVDSHQTLGIVGESGSGKSVLCRSLLRLVPDPPGRITAGEVLLNGRDLLKLSDGEMQRVRGGELKMIFQNPMTSLNPVWPIGDQITEGLRVHQKFTRRAARAEGIELLRRVGIASPEQRYDEYPFQWSGGMLQRAVIAMAMAGTPSLLIADEATTALDVTIQDQILALLVELQERSGMAMIMVSHDLGVVAETCDRIAVMYGGRIVEEATTRQIFEDPRHPYTAGLLACIPRLEGNPDRLPQISGQPPDLAALPAGCPFSERCPVATPDCATTPVALAQVGNGHATACLYPERVENPPSGSAS